MHVHVSSSLPTSVVTLRSACWGWRLTQRPGGRNGSDWWPRRQPWAAVCRGETVTKTQREREGGRSSRKSLHLFHSARGPAVPSGAHKLQRRRPLAEDWVGQNVQPVYFHQHGSVTQPGDPETWARLGEVWLLDEVRFHHRQLGIQNLRCHESETRIQ